MLLCLSIFNLIMINVLYDFSNVNTFKRIRHYLPWLLFRLKKTSNLNKFINNNLFCNVENSFYFIGKKQSKGKKRIQMCTFLCIYLLLRTNIVYGVLYLFTTLSPVRARVDIACDIDTVKSFVLVGVNFTRILFSEIRKGVDPCIHFYV